jgi:hypothetical protein
MATTLAMEAMSDENKFLGRWKSNHHMFTPIHCKPRLTPPGLSRAVMNASLFMEDPTIQTLVVCPAMKINFLDDGNQIPRV